MSKGRILSGMRPTGKLHLGHLSVLENWVKLQEEYDCFYFIADWHALTTSFDKAKDIKEHSFNLMLDWLSVGLDPEKSTIFVQSDVKQHAELHLLLSMLTPLSWLERVPTYKDQIKQFGEAGKDISTYGFLGYPLLQAADILLYKATAVPVGEDQIPHVEITREIGRRFNHMTDTKIMVEPECLLAKIRSLPGVDNRKMSKSYGNDIALNAGKSVIEKKVRQMITDPARIRKDDIGNPDVCTVYTYHTFYNKDEAPEIASECRKGKIGCMDCKKRLTEVLDDFIAPIREKRALLKSNPDYVYKTLEQGKEKATENAEKTMQEVRKAMGV